jgi:putative ABC transport system substrate-binding protein
MRICLRRREFLAGLGGAAAWPLAARRSRATACGASALLVYDPLTKSELSAFTQALADLGWTDGRNVRAAGSAAIRLTPSTAPMMEDGK